MEKKKRSINTTYWRKQIRQDFKDMDKLMMVAVLFMQAIGILMIYSITSITKYNGASDNPFHFVFVTIIAIILGSFMMLVLFFIPYKHYKLLGFLAVFINPFLLILTLLIGGGPGVRSWIDLKVLTVQPAEFVKVGMAFALAFLIDKQVQKNKFDLKKVIPKTLEQFQWSFWSICTYIVTCCGLIIAQPDMGTTIIILSIAGIMLLCSGLSFKTIGKLFLITLPLILFAGDYLLTKNEYQAARFDVWFDPFNHEKGFQNVMGYTAMALGGLFGVGIGQSTQKYGYVIEPHNDFIVTIVAEELGVLMVVFLMVVYLFMSLRCFLLAAKCKDLFGSLLMIGIGSMFLVQPVVNLGGASGFIPLTGVTLPFISYGGSSTMVFFIAVGVYLNVAKAVKQAKRLELEPLKNN